MNMRYFDNLHPAVSFFYFAAVIGMTLACMHPVMTAVSLCGALLFAMRLRGGRALLKTMGFLLPMILIVAIANPLFNHRGVTLLFILFDQWITLEALCYGFVSAGMLAAVILWFVCYQQVMTSDKFLFLFGQIAPATALLVTMTLRLIPQLGERAKQIRECQKMLREEDKRLIQKLAAALRNLSALLTWSMESAIETADSMKARGYGLKRRSTFHLFQFDSRDARAMGLMLALSLPCALARLFGHGTMEFYPRMDAVITGESGLVMYGLYLLLALLPTILEAKEAVKWRSYGLIR